MSTPRWALFILTVCLTGSGCNPKPPPPNPKTRFQGITLRIAIPQSEPLANWLDDQCGEWSAETAAQVERETVSIADIVAPHGSIPGSALAEPTSFHGDILAFPSTQMANVVAATLATRLPKEVFESTEYENQDIARAVHDQVISWDRQPYGFPLSADCMLVYYRADLFADEALRSAFQEKFGQPLEPPATWDDFDRLAEFFSGRDLNGDQVPDHGAVLSSAGDALICRAAAYGKVPQNFSFFFDVNTLEPLTTGPAFEEALTKWLAIANYLVPQAEGNRSLTSFSEGRAAMALGSSRFASQWFRSDTPANNRVNGRVACVPVPGNSRVYQHDKHAWVELPHGDVNRASIVTGLVAAVPKSCRNTAAAFDFLTFLTNRERSLPTVSTSAYGFGPYRLSHVVDVAAWATAGWQVSRTGTLLSAIRLSLNHNNAVALLRIDASDRYHQALDESASAAFRGDIKAAEALAAVAESWSKISTERGLDRQRRSYRYSLGMPVVN